MKKIFLVTAFTLIAQIATAQTITATLGWTDADTLANVNAYTVSLKMDTAAAVLITPTCAVSGTVVACTAPLTGFVTSAAHTIVLTNTNASGESASATLNYTPPPPPVSGAGLSIVIKITIP